MNRIESMNCSGSEPNESAVLIRKLCSHVTRKSDDSSTYRFVIRALSTAPLPHDYDEFVIAEKIKKKLVRQNRQKDAVVFSDLCRKLQCSPVLKNRSSVLTLLFGLYGTNVQFDKYAQFASELARVAAGSPEIALHAKDIISARPTVQSKMRFSSENENYIENQKDFGSPKNGFGENGHHFGENGDATTCDDGRGGRVAHVAAMFTKKSDTQKHQYVTWSTVRHEKVTHTTTTTSNSTVQDIQSENINFMLQRDILHDILYAVQGISGTNITWRQDHENFIASVSGSIPNSTQKLVLRFAELGWMYSKVNYFCSAQSSEKTMGLVGQGFVAALKQELMEYYRLLAVLQSQLQEENDCKKSETLLPLTLHRLSVWFMDPFQRLKVLAALVDAVSGKKGGALASVLYCYLQHGDKSIHEPVKRLLVKTIQPIYRMVHDWIFCGEFEDAFNEFFVTENVNVSQSCMWQEKYSLNKSMIPAFFTMDQAKRILSTGKSINFLRHVCNNSFIGSEESNKKAWDAKKMESLFIQDSDGEFQLMLDQNYLKTSSLVLSSLHNEYKLMEHFQAMRNYFLLGQGDFIRHLMDLLESDLSKPAKTLYIHNLSGILESAIRATNAQYHDPDILQRLDVRLLEFSLGDTGWDVFTLDYHVDGPIGTVFTPQSMRSYLRLFNSLWRAKHVEYILSSIWHSRTTYLNIQKCIPDVAPITYQCHVILSQMVHLIQQVQYYLAFEVMECCWADLLHKIEQAKDLDEVLNAHEMFLDTLLTRSLLSEESKSLRTHLQALYERITEFEKIQDNFWSQATELVTMQEEQQQRVEKKTKSGDWGTSETSLEEYKEKLANFKKMVVPTAKAELKILAYSYEEMVQKFLVMLNDHEDPNLRFLSFRLDFNEHFKSKNTHLRTSLTYLHRRRSLKNMNM